MSYFISGEKEDWEVVIGLEVHAQVVSDSKLFSDASTEFGAKPNTQVSLVDSAMPGMLPVLNETAVRQAVRTGLAINAKINKHSIFARKNYFYPDSPFGYQISQYEEPIVGVSILIPIANLGSSAGDCRDFLPTCLVDAIDFNVPSESVYR